MKLLSIGLLADTWGTNGHMGGGWWIVMMVGMMLFWVAVIVGIVWAIRGASYGWRDRGGEASYGWRDRRDETPLEILDRRFAEGAISADEYRERREVITKGPDPSRTETSEPSRP